MKFEGKRTTEYQTCCDSTKIHVFADKLISGLAFDWIAGNLYGVSWAGIVFACKARGAGRMTKCSELVKDQGILRGIALDPQDG